METINDVRVKDGLPAVSMSISPEGAPVAITIDGVAYTWTNKKHHRAGTALTFTAVVAGLSPGITDVEHFWDFGDGHTGYGPVVAHTYQFASPAIVRLKVTDSIGRVTETFRVMSLVPSTSAAAVLSGSGTLTVTATTTVFTIGLSGHGTLTANANEIFNSPVSSLAGHGTLTATAV